MITRRRVLAGALATLAAPPASAQTGRIPRVGVIAPGAGPAPGMPPLGALAALIRGLQAHGYSVGQNLVLDVRWDRADPGTHRRHAQDLVSGGVDVIVAATTASTLAARSATRTIPIVMAASGGGDPVELGLAESLGRPGGNVTGVSLLTHVLPGKRLELLKEVMPAAVRIGLMWNPTRPGQTDVKDHETAAHPLGLGIVPFEIRRSEDIVPAFQAARQGGAQAIVLAQGAFFTVHSTKIVEAATATRLPTLSGETGYAQQGGLMNFGPNIADAWHRSAVYVDRILKGTRPGDLPIEQPTKFELAINLKTARALGLRVPPSLLLRADQVID